MYKGGGSSQTFLYWILNLSLIVTCKGTETIYHTQFWDYLLTLLKLPKREEIVAETRLDQIPAQAGLLSFIHGLQQGLKEKKQNDLMFCMLEIWGKLLLIFQTEIHSVPLPMWLHQWMIIAFLWLLRANTNTI